MQESAYFVVPHGVAFAGVTMPTAQHHICLFKAQLFGDHEAAARVRAGTDATEAKAATSRLKDFDEEIWKRRCLKVALLVTYAKFSQHADLRKYLIKTQGVLYQTKSKDKFWSIGVDQTSSEAGVAHVGQNHMGKIVEKVRQRLRLEEEVMHM